MNFLEKLFVRPQMNNAYISITDLSLRLFYVDDDIDLLNHRKFTFCWMM